MPDTALADPALGSCLLDDLMVKHAPAVIAYAEKILQDRHLAEDIAQEAFIRAWPHTQRLCSTAGSIRGWLLTVTRHLIIDRSRSSMVRNEVVGANASFAADHRAGTLPDHADSVATSMHTLGLLHDLSPEHRRVLLHLYVFEHSLRETADLIGIPVGTVKSRHHYALNALRSRLAAE
ncbi:sigma-70 family RNA polymerase sigma factor [Streptomyces sp. NPDC058394]|uniref:sigma-70 family RNA polymerase sigma factor n=1 Tax=Streptomyces sp. NPDC058394 TaxID=3346477 RepID=UPI00364858E8